MHLETSNGVARPSNATPEQLQEREERNRLPASMEELKGEPSRATDNPRSPMPVPAQKTSEIPTVADRATDLGHSRALDSSSPPSLPTPPILQVIDQPALSTKEKDPEADISESLIHVLPELAATGGILACVHLTSRNSSDPVVLERLLESFLFDEEISGRVLAAWLLIGAHPGTQGHVHSHGLVLLAPGSGLVAFLDRWSASVDAELDAQKGTTVTGWSSLVGSKSHAITTVSKQFRRPGERDSSKPWLGIVPYMLGHEIYAFAGFGPLYFAVARHIATMTVKRRAGRACKGYGEHECPWRTVLTTKRKDSERCPRCRHRHYRSGDTYRAKKATRRISDMACSRRVSQRKVDTDVTPSISDACPNTVTGRL